MRRVYSASGDIWGEGVARCFHRRSREFAVTHLLKAFCLGRRTAGVCFAFAQTCADLMESSASPPPLACVGYLFGACVGLSGLCRFQLGALVPVTSLAAGAVSTMLPDTIRQRGAPYSCVLAHPDLLHSLSRCSLKTPTVLHIVTLTKDSSRSFSSSPLPARSSSQRSFFGCLHHH